MGWGLLAQHLLPHPNYARQAEPYATRFPTITVTA